MSAPRAPRMEERRTAQFAAELRARARAWMPGWGIADGEADVGAALLDIAARFSSEVAERLDRGGEKMRRGFLDWLAVRGKAARPARMPVVFKLADAARESVLAEAPVRLQADANGIGVVFETEHDVRVVPGRLQVVVGVDAGTDQFYLAPPGLNDLTPFEPVPVQWELKSFAAAGSRTMQLDPESGLVADMILDAGGAEYRVVQVDKGIVTMEPALGGDLSTPLTVRKVTSFAPFDGVSRNRQEHALYLGDMDLLNIEAAATIDVVGATALVAGVVWQYWGKVDGIDVVGWQPLSLAKKQTVQGAVRLEKPKGAIEPREIGAGNSSRWIRANAPSATGSAPMLLVDALELKVNCTDVPVCLKDAAKASPAAEAMANTTPIVLDNVFFPLGKEPRQFDAFYLGSQEAFSKKDAKVQLCFEMADPTFTALSAVREGTFANGVLAGVAADRALHLFVFSVSTGEIVKLRDREPVQPPLPGSDGVVVSGPAVALDKQPSFRLPTWAENDLVFGTITIDGFVVAVSAGDAVWLWREKVLDVNASGWISLGNVPATAVTPSKPMAGLVYLADALAPQLVALRNGQMSVRPRLGTQPWTAVPTRSAGVAVPLETIAPVLAPNALQQLVTSVADEMVGISSAGKLFRVQLDGTCTAVIPARTFRSDVPPVSVNDAVLGVVVIAVEAMTERLVAYRQFGGAEVDVALDGTDAVIGGLDVAVIGGVIHVAATVDDGGAGKLVAWAPFAAGAAAARLDSSVSSSGTQAGGMPTVVGTRVVIPGKHADVLVGEYDPSRRHVEQGTVETGVVLPATVPALAVNDLIVRRAGNAASPVAITALGTTKDNETFYPLASAFPAGTTRLDAYRLADVKAGTLTAMDMLELDPTDMETVASSWLWIDGDIFRITNFDETVSPTVVTIASTTGGPPPGGTGDYVRPIATGGRVTSFIRMTPPTNGNWSAALLDRLPLTFPLLVPPQQLRGKAFTLGVGNKPGIVVLEDELVAVVNPVDYVIDEGVGAWSRLLGDTSANPELSWEYWNGKGWWKLPVTRDDTRHFKSSGALRFDVPRDIASSDWAGKTNFWIRARLIGGDYGREKITARTKDLGGGVTEQTVERSPSGIRAPSVVTLSISYGVCTAVQPTFVLAQDSGSIKDQSSANRTAGAIVEAFVPLAVTLARLADTPRVESTSDDCPPECGCQDNHAAVQGAQQQSTDATTALTTGRALYVGLDAEPSGASVNVLLLVDEERDHHAFAPMRVETLVADRFTAIVADDATRGLGESGLLTLAFTLPPTRRELFGQSLAWIRLLPAEGPDIAQWKPALRGAYLNAAWASATETLTRELVGSSEGAPFLTLNLARPPVLHDTLELRVREPLGDEERAALRRVDARSVLSDVDGLRGDWVKWRQVTDPDDELPQSRVYALDEGTGTIRFGDGLHGMIPPVGLDSIVAFSYQRTEPPKADSSVVPGNLIGARAPMNLVSPVESVESVAAADQSAGGAPPEADERVLRFGFARLRHRGRAMTAHDVEDVALESSPDIVQARCISRRDGVRLVVVMRGADPAPNASQVRELRRLLQSSGPTTFAAQGALRIEGPIVHRLRLELTLRVDALENAGALSEQVKQRVYALLDTATGGVEQTGWPLGASPSDVDVALALLDAPHLESIVAVVRVEILPDGTEQEWPSTLRSAHLTVLDDDPIRIRFETAEVTA